MKTLPYYIQISVAALLLLGTPAKANLQIELISASRKTLTFSISGTVSGSEGFSDDTVITIGMNGDARLPVFPGESRDLILSGNPIAGAQLYDMVGTLPVNPVYGDANSFSITFTHSLVGYSGGGVFSVSSKDGIPLFDTMRFGPEFHLYWGSSTLGAVKIHQSSTPAIGTSENIFIRAKGESGYVTWQNGSLEESNNLSSWSPVGTHTLFSFNTTGASSRFFRVVTTETE